MPLMRSLKVMRVCAGPGHIVFIHPEGTWVPDAVVEAAEAVGCIVIDEDKPEVEDTAGDAPKPPAKRVGRPPKRGLSDGGLDDEG